MGHAKLAVGALGRGLAALALAVAVASAPAAARAGGPRPLRIVHVMSYHAGWTWSALQLEGFRAALAGLPVQVRVIELDGKRLPPEAQARRAAEARALIDAWNPDLLYTSDDLAQELVARRLVGSRLPIVYSGVNEAPARYGFDGAPNVTGVLEREHVAEALQLLRQLVPGARRIAVVLDDDEMWGPVAARIREVGARLPGVELGPFDVFRTFDAFQRGMRAYPGRVDAVMLVGVFHFRGPDGAFVPYQRVLRWTAEHSHLPDVSFWGDRVRWGTLAAVTVSEREQGLAAGRLARAILAEGRAPSSLPVAASTRGVPLVSLARARSLGIVPSTSLLLSSEVIRDYPWDDAP